jgi:polyvinyl alcohol dehydrogenase (cytochrome)
MKMLSGKKRRAFLGLQLALALGALVTAAAGPAAPAPGASWPSGGQNISNTHSNPAETKINADNAGQLAVKWTYTTHGDVSAIPAVVNGAVYFPDWGGYLNKVDAATGAPIWSYPISNYDGLSNSAARAAPAVVGNTVYLGDQGSQPTSSGGGNLSAIDATSGKGIWTTRVDSHPYAILTSGPLVYNGVIYQGVASSEEGAAANGAYPCCTFRGSIVAVDAATGAVLWKTYMVPDNGGVPCQTQNPVTGCGYSGGAIWGTTPAIDPATNTLFVTTGNNYTVPDSVKTCESAGNPASACLDPNDHVDSVLALNASTGAIKWATGVQGFDDWNVACIPGFGSPNNCPDHPGPDYDFGSGPNLFTIMNAKGKRQLVVGAGQKSGQYWALDAATGTILWSQAAGPGSTLGGIEWGPATDGKRIYVAEENFFGIPYTLPSGETITSGSWAAIDPGTGGVLWQTPDPSHNAFGGGNALGPVSVANGVLYAPSMSGHVYALDAANGRFLWDYQTPGAAISGAAVVNGTVYWGDGYTHLGIPGWNGSTTFYAFSIHGH